jgi:hypothetical protein
MSTIFASQICVTVILAMPYLSLWRDHQLQLVATSKPLPPPPFPGSQHDWYFVICNQTALAHLFPATPIIQGKTKHKHLPVAIYC